MEKGYTNKKAEFLTLAFLLCLLIVFNSFIVSRFGLSEELGVYVDMLGVMTVLQILLAVFLTTISKGGYFYAVILFSIETVIVAARLAVMHEMILAPMLAMILLGICVLYVIHRLIITLTSKEEQVEEMSHKDILTDLPNRRAVREHMEK